MDSLELAAQINSSFERLKERGSAVSEYVRTIEHALNAAAFKRFEVYRTLDGATFTWDAYGGRYRFMLEIGDEKPIYKPFGEFDLRTRVRFFEELKKFAQQLAEDR